MPKITIINHFKKLIFVLVFLNMFFSPIQGYATSPANTNDYFYQQRLACTNTYYNKANYPQASDCYRGSWNRSCGVNQDACNKASNNITIAMTRYKNDVCNQKFYNNDFTGASACYEVGINQTCNLQPSNIELCNIFKSNKNLANQRIAYSYNSSIGCITNCNPSFSNQISQLQSFKDTCNQNWYNGQLKRFRDCSQQGVNLACSLFGSEAQDLCNRFRNNVNLANQRIEEISYWNRNGCFNYNYSYNKCTSSNVPEEIKTAALILTGVTVICAIAGCFN